MRIMKFFGRNANRLIVALSIIVGTTLLVAYAPAAVRSTSLVARLWSVASSTFFIAVVSTFAAAFAGAWGAQLIANNSQDKRILLDEIRATNTSRRLAFNVINTYLVFKQQHIRELCRQYREQCAAHAAHLGRIRANSVIPSAPFRYEPNLGTLIPPFSPIEELKHVLLDRVECGRAQILLTPLLQSIDTMKTALVARNEWIKARKDTPPEQKSEEYFADLYFGIESPGGRLDQTYPNCIEALGQNNDNCIGFALVLMQALEKYAEELCDKLGRGGPKMKKADFAKAAEEGLLPEMAVFIAWAQ